MEKCSLRSSNSSQVGGSYSDGGRKRFQWANILILLLDGFKLAVIYSIISSQHGGIRRSSELLVGRHCPITMAISRLLPCLVSCEEVWESVLRQPVSRSLTLQPSPNRRTVVIYLSDLSTPPFTTYTRSF